MRRFGCDIVEPGDYKRVRITAGGRRTEDNHLSFKESRNPCPTSGQLSLVGQGFLRRWVWKRSQNYPDFSVLRCGKLIGCEF